MKRRTDHACARRSPEEVEDHPARVVLMGLWELGLVLAVFVAVFVLAS